MNGRHYGITALRIANRTAEGKFKTSIWYFSIPYRSVVVVAVNHWLLIEDNRRNIAWSGKVTISSAKPTHSTDNFGSIVSLRKDWSVH